MATSPIEIRLAHLEGAYEQVNARLGTIDGRLGSLEVKLEERLSSLEAKFEDRFGRLEDRFAQLEGKFDDRFGRSEDRFSRLEDKMERRFSRLEEKGDGMRTEFLARTDRQFYWILTLVVLSILVPIFLRLLNA